MKQIRSAIEDTVSISQFNRGMAGKIFDEVKRQGAKVVMKNNNPECVLLSPEEYIYLLDSLHDERLLKIAKERTENITNTSFISQDEVDKEFGFSLHDIEKSDIQLE